MLNLQDTTVKPFPLSSMVIHKYKYHDRDIYCRITADYKGKTITVRFKGTKIIGTKYKWSLENEDAFEVFKK